MWRRLSSVSTRARETQQASQGAAAGQPRGFHEREIAQGTETFGGIAHVWSTYESRYSVDDPEPFSRGINSFQLVRFENRWRVVTIFWDVERPSQSIPDEYLR